MDEQEQPRRRGFLIIISILVVLLAVAGGVIAFYGLGPMLARPVNSNVPVKDASDALGMNRTQPTPMPNAGMVPVRVDEPTMASLMASIRQQVQVPANEQPQVNQIRDISQLQGQPFFAQSQNEDVVLIFPSKLVVLYRPSTGQVFGSGTITNQP